MKIFKILKSIFTGVLDATPLGSASKMLQNYKDENKPTANLLYVGTFILTFLIIILFAFGKIDENIMFDLIKKLN